MKVTIGIILLIPILIWGTLRTINSITYGIDCGGHIKRAADANTVEMAKKELRTVLDYLEQREMTKGYTSTLYQTPDEDVAFWYTNLSQSYKELEQVNEKTTALEKSNLLIKLRETLLDQGENGINITQPSGISIFPKNGGYAIFGWIGAVLACLGCGLIIWKLREYLRATSTERTGAKLRH